MSFAVAQYRSARAQTASPVQVVVDLYRGAIRFLREGIAFDGTGDVSERARVLGRAHAIISELQATLDREHAPELCDELDQLYDFVLHQITDANVTNDTSALPAAIEVLGTLESAWAQLASQG